MILVGERPERGQVPGEHLRAVAVRAAMPDVVDHRPADLLQQRQLRRVTGLGLPDQQPVAGPVEAGELQPPDVDAAQPEPGDQQDDRVVPLPARVVPVDRLEDPGDLAGIPDRGDPGLLAGAGGRDRLQAGGAGQAAGGREPQERPQPAQFLPGSLGLVARQRGDELPGDRPVGPHRRHGTISSPKVRLEPGDRLGAGPVQLAHRPVIAAQHRPVRLVLAQHLGDPEQVHIGLLQGAGPLLAEEAARSIDPRHRRIQRELLDAAGSEVPLHPPPAAPVPDERRVLVAQAPQLRLQARHQGRQSRHDS